MKKLYLVRPEWPEVPGFDFKIDIEFETERAAEEYCKENSITHYYIEETIPNRELFFIDIMARIPYGVKFRFELDNGVYKTVSTTDAKDLPHLDILYSYWMGRGYFLPYLRPMSSMTEDEMKELRQEHVKDMKMFADCLTKSAEGDNSERGKVISHYAADWCNKNHFDYRGLIPMGLALEAPDGLYET